MLELVPAACWPGGHRTIAQSIQSNLILILDKIHYTCSDSALRYKFPNIAGGNARPMNSVRVYLALLEALPLVHPKQTIWSQ